MTEYRVSVRKHRKTKDDFGKESYSVTVKSLTDDPKVTVKIDSSTDAILKQYPLKAEFTIKKISEQEELNKDT